MAPRQNAAYDLSRFETKTQERPKQEERLQVIKTRKSQQKASMRAAFRLRVAGCAVIAVSVIACMLYNRAVLAELGVQVSTQKVTLNELDGEYVRLLAELDSKISLQEAEEYASITLGMEKISQSQIQYLNLNDGDKVELGSKKVEEDLTGKIFSWFSSLWNTLQKS